MTERAEALRFEKSLELAQKQIREKKVSKELTKPPTEKGPDTGAGVNTVMEGVELRAHIPLTDTTKRLSLHGSPEHKVPLAQPESDGEFTDGSSERGGDDTEGEKADPPSTTLTGSPPEGGKGQEEELTPKAGSGVTNGNTARLAAPQNKASPASPSTLRLSTFGPAAPTTAPVHSGTPGRPPGVALAPPRSLIHPQTGPRHLLHRRDGDIRHDAHGG